MLHIFGGGPELLNDSGRFVRVGKVNKTVVLGQNQSFGKLSIGGIPIVYNFTSPLVTKILFLTEGVNGIKLKRK